MRDGSSDAPITATERGHSKASGTGEPARTGWGMVQSILAPLARTTLPQRSVSALTKLPNTSGELHCGLEPCAEICWTSSGDANADLTAAFRVASTAFGVLAGAIKPFQL